MARLDFSIEYDPDLGDITVEQVSKALKKFLVPSRSLHIYERRPTPLAPDGGERRRLLRRIETLAWTLIESAQKGYISSNDVDLANDHLNKAQVALQTPTAGKA
jgi:hypothetical protein